MVVRIVAVEGCEREASTPRVTCQRAAIEAPKCIEGCHGLHSDARHLPRQELVLYPENVYCTLHQRCSVAVSCQSEKAIQNIHTQMHYPGLRQVPRALCSS